MNRSILLLLTVIQISSVWCATSAPDVTTTTQHNSNKNGKYVPDNRGKYIPRDENKYVHVHDMRELGRYIHIPFPYDGGYGPYSGKNIPYEYDPTGEYSIAKYQTVSTPFQFDPFKTNEYTIPIPDICLQYGFPRFAHYPAGTSPQSPYVDFPVTNKPNSIFSDHGDDKDHIPIIEKRESISSQNNDAANAPDNINPPIPAVANQNSDLNSVQKPVQETIDDTKSINENVASAIDADSIAAAIVFPADKIVENNNNNNNLNGDGQNLDVQNVDESHDNDDDDVKHVRVRKSIFEYSQTKVPPTPPTTARPRTRYDDEGHWKIIRHDEKKNKKNYEYLYETENGILAQEKASINKPSSSDAEGTNAHGFYQYPGDDGKIYRVEYTVGEQGFIPKGDHLPKALQQSLERQRTKQHPNQL